MKICVIIPVHNESHAIGRVVAGIRKIPLDVTVIDDGSTDDSGRLAVEQGAGVLRNGTKSGKGFSLKRGFAYVLENDYGGVITMDGDGQHDVDDLKLFLEKIKDRPQSVITGNRMLHCRNMPCIRYLTNRFMSFLISRICGQFVPDTQCGFRYISTEILKQVKLVSEDYEIETEVLIKASRLGYPILSVPVKTIYGEEKSKVNPLKDTIRFIIYLAKEIRVKV